MTELKCLRLSKGNGLDGNGNFSRSVVHFGSVLHGHILHAFSTIILWTDIVAETKDAP